MWVQPPLGLDSFDHRWKLFFFQSIPQHQIITFEFTKLTHSVVTWTTKPSSNSMNVVYGHENRSSFFFLIYIKFKTVVFSKIRNWLYINEKKYGNLYFLSNLGVWCIYSNPGEWWFPLKLGILQWKEKFKKTCRLGSGEKRKRSLNKI